VCGLGGGVIQVWGLGGGVRQVCGYHAHVSVDVEDALVGALLVEFGQNQLLHPEDNTVSAADSDGRATHTHTHTHTQSVMPPGAPGGSSFFISSHLLFSTAFMAYSTWNTRPSGEKVEADRSY